HRRRAALGARRALREWRSARRRVDRDDSKRARAGFRAASGTRFRLRSGAGAAAHRAPRPRGAGRAVPRLVDIVLGRRLANREYGERKIGAFEGLPAMGLDALGSSSYGPEAAL